MKDISMQDSLEVELMIPEELRGVDLRCYLYPPRFDIPLKKQAVEILHKVCVVDLTDRSNRERIDTTQFTEEERKFIINNRWCESNNLEVKARCNDVIGRYDKDKRPKKIIASEIYLLLYNSYNEINFLIRSITVRDFKDITTDDFLNQVKDSILQQYNHPFWIEIVVNALKRSFSIEKLKWLSDFIEDQKNISKNNNDFREEREYIKAQLLLNAIERLDFHKELALSFEKEADETANNNEENTFYPHLVHEYQEAYNEASQIKKMEPELYERIKEKLLREKKNFMQMLAIGGVKFKLEIPEDFINNVEEVLSVTSIDNYNDTIGLMLSIPFVSKEDIDAYQTVARGAGVLQLMFGTSILDNKGNIVGSADSYEALKTEAHVHFRNKRLYLIKSYLYLHRWSKINDEEVDLYYYLKHNKSEFVEEENLIFWAKGIHAGLKGDFITASFILTPQIENALYNIAEKNLGDITTLEKERQLLPTLGAIIPHLENVVDDVILFEISSFLQGEIDVNFRNNLLHGLFKPIHIEMYGPYLLWLSIKLYFGEIIV